jgi:ferredoxin-NADP reductase
MMPTAREEHPSNVSQSIRASVSPSLSEPSDRQPGERKLMTARLHHSVPLSDQVKHLEFTVVDAEEFPFIPGQFVSIQQPKPDGKVHTRAYSIASAPGLAASFDLCLNRVEQGFLSNWLCDLEIGATVEFHGPHGMFTLREPRHDAIFIATGTGIAPIRGIVHWLFAQSDRNQGHEFWLVYGTRHESGLYYRDQFLAIEQAHPNFHYVPTLSRGNAEWPGLRGYVQEHVRGIVDKHQDLEAYICGLHQMVDANRKLLKEELGWDRRRIIFERYD